VKVVFDVAYRFDQFISKNVTKNTAANRNEQSWFKQEEKIDAESVVI